jgi:hypothetical protein
MAALADPNASRYIPAALSESVSGAISISQQLFNHEGYCPTWIFDSFR